MSYMNINEMNNGSAVQELTFEEIDAIGGGDATTELVKAGAKAVLRSPIKFAGGVGVGLTIAAVAVLVVAEIAEG